MRDGSAKRQLVDSFGRTIDNLRISVTDRCNFRCRYCMPEEGMTWRKKDELLSFEEITRLTTIVAGLGVTRLRLTGGEPLMRRDLPDLVRQLNSVPGISDIALTTNGYFLADLATRLADAGLSRINISMDSLNPKTFSAMIRRDYHGAVMRGLEAVEKTSIRPIKINVVLLRGINDGEIEDLAWLARTKPYTVRFIEFMPIGAEDDWTIDHVVPTSEVLGRINAMSGFSLMPVENGGGEPAELYRFSDGRGEIGVISSVSEPFCGSCNRIRITSDGQLRTCLFSLDETDLRGMLRSGATDSAVSDAIVTAVTLKEAGHLINRPGFVRPERTMSSIGG
jgi:cyclic pyranopterin phosphate synthase